MKNHECPQCHQLHAGEFDHCEGCRARGLSPLRTIRELEATLKRSPADVAVSALAIEVVREDRVYAMRLRAAQRELDGSGYDRDVAARVAGRLLDLAEQIEKRAEQLANEVRERASG